MKPWMKFLMWFGLGTALGLSAGHQIGYNKAKHEDEETINEAYKRGRADEAYKDLGHDVDIDKYQKRIRQIYGFPDPQERYVDPPQPDTDEDPEMPMDEPVVPEPENEGVQVESRTETYPEGSVTYGVIKEPGDIIHGRKMSDIESASALFDDPPAIPVGAIQQFHPTFIVPRIVTEEEYDTYGDLDEKVLIYYEGDDVLYCVEDQKPIGEDEQPCLIGIGTLQGFRVGPGEPKDELFVVNETYGRFKIYRMDDAFADAVDGTCAPDDEEDDDI